MRRSAYLLAVALSAPAAASAQPMAAMQGPPVCPVQAALPAELEPFRTPVAVTAGDGTGATPVIDVGVAAVMALKPVATVRYPAPLSKPQANGQGGLAALTIARAGTYRVALSAAAWIDVAGKAGPVEAASHGRGPSCTGIAKMVDFALVPGRYTLEIAGAGVPTLTVLIARRP